MLDVILFGVELSQGRHVTNVGLVNTNTGLGLTYGYSCQDIWQIKF